MPRKSSNKFESILVNGDVHISREGWYSIAETTYNMNKKRKMKKYVFSVPKSIYISVGVVCIVMILPQFFVNGNSYSGITQILANIGYSLLASDVAGILFDLGNNFSKSKEDKKVYYNVTLGHYMLIDEIVLVANYTCMMLKISEFQNMNLKQKLQSVLYEGFNNEFLKTKEYKDATEDILYWLYLVRETSKELLKVSYIMYENKEFDEEKRTKLRLLISIANEACGKFKKYNLEDNKTVFTLIGRIDTILVKLYLE